MYQSLVLALVLATSGCGKGGLLDSIPGIERYLPKVGFDSLAIKDVSFEQIDTTVVLAVKNPYPLKVSLASFSWDFELDGHHVIGGKGKDGLTLDPSGTSKIRLPVSIVYRDLFDLVGTAAGANAKDAVPFAVSGSMGFDTPLGVVRIPWRGKGNFPVLRAPKVKLAGLRLDRIDVAGLKATLALDLDLTHEQHTSLTFHGLDYGLSFGGHHVLDGAMERLTSVAPGITGRVSLPLTIDLVGVGGTIADAIRHQGSLDVGFGATVQIDTPIGTVPLSLDEKGKLKIGR